MTGKTRTLDSGEQEGETKGTEAGGLPGWDGKGETGGS